MSNNACSQLRTALLALAEGRFDAATPDEMSLVEAHLNECPRCAAMLGNAPATPEGHLSDAGAVPAAERWDEVWMGIEDAVSTVPSPQRTPRSARRLRTWTGLAAAAAVVLAVTAWQFVPFHRTPRWGFRLAGADDTQIESLEVFGQATSLVLGGGEESGPSIIWVMEEEETEQ